MFSIGKSFLWATGYTETVIFRLYIFYW